MSRLIEAKEDRLKFRNWIKDGASTTFSDLPKDRLDTFADRVTDTFIEFKPRLKSPYNDFYHWMKNSTFEDFYNYLRELQAKVGQDKLTKEKEKDGARLVYSDDNWKVYEITTYEASAKYGKGTKWCISGSKRWTNGDEGSRYFDDYYSQNGVRFYFFINKDGNKYALAVYPEGSCEIFNAEDVAIPFIPNAPVVDEIKAEYKNESDSNILVNAIMNKKLPEDILERIIQETFEDNTGFECEIFSKDQVDELISEVDNMIPDGYLETTDNDEDWDGDLPYFAFGELEALSGHTKEEKIESLKRTLRDEADYIVLEDSYDGWEIDPIKDYTQLFLWAMNRCGISDWSEGELDDFFINSLDSNDLEHAHPGRMYVFPIMLANRLIWDIKNGDISGSVLNGIGLSDNYLKNFRESFDKIYFENEKVSDSVLNEAKNENYYYHGSSDGNLKELNRPINWLTKDYEYAKFFALATTDSGYVYKCNPTIGNLFDAGETFDRVYDLNPIPPYRLSRTFEALVRRLGLSEDKVNKLLQNVISEYELPNNGYRMKIDLVTRSVAFKRILESLGYDGIHAIEYNEKANTKHETLGLFDKVHVLDCDEINESLNEKNYNRPTKMYDFNGDEVTWDKDAEDNLWWGSESDKWAENYAKSYKVKMSPKDYLDLTTDKGANAYKVGDSIGGLAVRELDKDELNKETYQPIFLLIAFRDANNPSIAQVVGHEGRHRMFALMNAGYNKVDVELRCEVWDTNFEKYKPFELDSIDLQGQFNKGVWVTVYNPIPMSWKNHKAIRPDLKDEDLNEYLDTIESSSEVYSDYPIMLTDEPYKLKNMLEKSDVPYRIFKLNDVYYFQNALGNKTHWDMMNYAIQKGYADGDAFDIYNDEAFMVFIPSGFDGDMRYFTSLGEDSYYCVAVYSYGRIYVRDSYALKNSLFNALGKPERVVYYDYDGDICTIVKDNKEVDISVEYDLDGEPDNAITFDIYSIFNFDEVARDVIIEDYEPTEEDFPYDLDDICREYPNLISNNYESCGNAFIMPDGRFILSGNKFDTHDDFAFDTLLKLGDFESEEEIEDTWDTDEILRAFTKYFDLVRVNDGSNKSVENRAYFVIPKNTLTSGQQNALLSYLEVVLGNKFRNKTYDIQAYAGKGLAHHSWDISDGDVTSDNILDDTKFALSRGFFGESLEEDATKEDILDALDKEFGQEEVYMWSTYILPNGHFLNPDNSKWWDEINEEPQYEHCDFEDWAWSHGYKGQLQTIYDNCIKMNVTSPYLGMPDKARPTSEQLSAIKEILRHQDNFYFEQPDWDNLQDDVEKMGPRVLGVFTPKGDKLFDLDVSDADDIVRAITQAYVRGYLTESKEELDENSIVDYLKEAGIKVSKDALQGSTYLDENGYFIFNPGSHGTAENRVKQHYENNLNLVKKINNWITFHTIQLNSKWGERYVLLFKKPTNEQYIQLLKWLDKFLPDLMSIEINYQDTPNGKWLGRKTYESNKYLPDDIIKDIKKFYDSGKLVVEKIVKKGNKWQVQSEKGRNLGTYDTKVEAEKRLQQVHYFKSLDEDYKDDFISRTNQHIARVNKYAKKIDRSYPNHDSDKFNELFDGYSLMNKKDVSEEEQKMIDDATYKHVINNEHHCEHWCNPKDVEGFSRSNPTPHGCLDCTKMPKDAMEEMCCDWCAMSEEFNNTPFEWYEKNKDTRWHFNEEQEKFILDTLHKLWNDKDLKEDIDDKLQKWQNGLEPFENVFDKDDIEYFNKNLQTTTTALYRCQMKKDTSNLKVGDILDFDRYRSFSKTEAGFYDVMFMWDDSDFEDDVVCFKTEGEVKYFDTKNKYTKDIHADDYEFGDSLDTQEEVFVKGKFKVIREEKVYDDYIEEYHKLFVIKQIDDKDLKESFSTKGEYPSENEVRNIFYDCVDEMKKLNMPVPEKDKIQLKIVKKREDSSRRNALYGQCNGNDITLFLYKGESEKTLRETCFHELLHIFTSNSSGSDGHSGDFAKYCDIINSKFNINLMNISDYGEEDLDYTNAKDYKNTKWYVLNTSEGDLLNNSKNIISKVSENTSKDFKFDWMITHNREHLEDTLEKLINNIKKEINNNFEDLDNNKYHAISNHLLIKFKNKLNIVEKILSNANIKLSIDELDLNKIDAENGVRTYDVAEFDYLKESLKESTSFPITVYTYQKPQVKELLEKGETYIASYSRANYSHYQDLAKVLGLSNCPIFGALDKKDLYEMLIDSGIYDWKEKDILHLEIPKEYLRYTEFWDWDRYISAMKDPKEWKRSKGLRDYVSLEELEKRLKTQKGADGYKLCQVVFDRIEPEWLSKEDVDESLKKLSGRGGDIFVSSSVYEVKNKVLDGNNWRIVGTKVDDEEIWLMSLSYDYSHGDILDIALNKGYILPSSYYDSIFLRVFPSNLDASQGLDSYVDYKKVKQYEYEDVKVVDLLQFNSDFMFEDTKLYKAFGKPIDVKLINVE